MPQVASRSLGISFTAEPWSCWTRERKQIDKKVLIIGIDGLDPILVERWKGELPHLARLEAEGAFLKLRSAFPPDSIPAWASIYTGMNPTAHGMLQTIDYLSKGEKALDIDFSSFHEKTFWDLAGKAGRRVCVVNPFLAYPVWPVNGVMVSGPVFVGGDVQAYPESVLHEYSIPPLGGIVDFPTRKTLKSFCRNARGLTEALAEFGLALFKREDWDLYFICFLTADRIQHFLWRYCDAGDPTCPGDDDLKDTIKEFYVLFDEIIGRFWETAGDRWTLMVLSDHGHGRRSTKTLNLNEFLRQKGYLASRVRRVKLLDPRFLIERLKTKALELMFQHDLEDIVARLVKFLPMKRSLKDSSFITDRGGSLAYAPDFAGRNPFGGVEICRAEVSRRGLDYEELRDQLMEEITRIRDPQNGKEVVQWIAPREELGSGPHIGKYPDLIFQLDPEYGLSWGLHGGLVGINPTHKKISGGHRQDGVLLVANAGREVARQEPCLVDIAPTILDLLKIPLEERFQGSSLLR
ncbi:alkaline phosphatase family protein [Candidatus Zixiibacteriota bacterium]